MSECVDVSVFVKGTKNKGSPGSMVVLIAREAVFAVAIERPRYIS